MQNTLQELFDKLTEYERQLIKGILPPHYTVGELLSLNGSDFLLKLQDSLPIKELGKLSAAEVKFRGDLMDKVVDAWSSSTNNNINTKDDNSNTEIRKRTPNENRDHFYHEVMARTTFKHIVILQKYYGTIPHGIYRFNGEIKTKRELEKIYEEERSRDEIDIANMLTDHDRDEILKRIQYNTLVDREEFDNGGDIKNVRNGLLNIITKELKPHTPDFLSTQQFSIIYDPNAKWPTETIKFLKEVQNRDGIITLLKMFGYILMTDTTKYQKAFFFVGRGNNGKSVLIDLIQAFVGKENCSAVKLHDLRNDRLIAAQLYGKTVNLYADMPSTGLSDVGYSRPQCQVTEITAQHKYGKPFTFRNRDKIICSGNTIPLSEGEDELAYFKRWVIVSFNALFTEEKQDKDLIKKLTTPENLSGLLKLALVGVMLLERDGFEDVPIEVIRDEYNRESQSLKAFVDNRCAIDLSRGDYYTLEDEFYNSYKEYCEKTQTEPPLSAKKVEIGLSRYKVFKGRKQLQGHKKPCYKGIIVIDTQTQESLLPV